MSKIAEKAAKRKARAEKRAKTGEKEVIDMYQVKVTQKDDPDNVCFGRVLQFHEDAEKLWEEGKIIIEEPVYGQQYLVELDKFDIEEQPFGDWSNRDEETGFCIDSEYDRYINEEYKAHMKRSEAAGEGIAKDKMFTVGVADGNAFYVITSAGKKNVKIEWRGFCPDNYHDMTLGWGGSFPRHCIEPHVRCADGMRKLFGR